MTLAADVFHPGQPQQTLLKRGFQLDQTVLKRLRDLEIQAVYVDYPGLEELDKQLAPCLSPERLKVFSQVKSTISAVRGTTRPTVGFADYYAAIREFSLTLFQQGDHPVYMDQIGARLGADGVAHATAVAHLALVMGIRLQCYLMDQRKRLSARHASEVVNLGIAGMLHDIGKAKLPSDLAHFSGEQMPDDPGKRAEWESHCQMGYEIIRNGVEPTAAVAVLQHHEHFDGSGFPEIRDHGGQAIPMNGERIHVFARVLLVADLFDHLVNPKAGARRPNVEALHRLKRDYSAWIDPRVYDALVEVVPPFPPGAKVRLSDGTVAVVTAPGKDPYRPIVRRLIGDGWELDKSVLNLTLDPSISIDSISGVSVGEYIPATPRGVRSAVC